MKAMVQGDLPDLVCAVRRSGSLEGTMMPAKKTRPLCVCVSVCQCASVYIMSIGLHEYVQNSPKSLFDGFRKVTHRVLALSGSEG